MEKWSWQAACWPLKLRERINGHKEAIGEVHWLGHAYGS
jgi:hypothetical protein